MVKHFVNLGSYSEVSLAHFREGMNHFDGFGGRLGQAGVQAVLKQANL